VSIPPEPDKVPTAALRLRIKALADALTRIVVSDGAFRPCGGGEEDLAPTKRRRSTSIFLKPPLGKFARDSGNSRT